MFPSQFVLRLLPVALLAHASMSLAGTNNVDLSTTLVQVDPAPVAAGVEFQLNWGIANNSSNVSSQALGSLELDPSANFVSASCPSAIDAGALVWTPPSVDIAAPRQCLVTLVGVAMPPTTLAFVASVDTSPQDSDTDPSNNSASVEVDIEQANVDLLTTLELVGQAPVVAGSEFQLNWVIANLSNSVASEPLGILEFDAQAQFIAASCPSVVQGGRLIWLPPSVDNASPRQCLVTLRGTATPPVTLNFVANVSPSPQDADSDVSNNSSFAAVDLERGAVAATELPVGGLPALLALCLGMLLLARARLRRLASGLVRR